MSTTKRGRPATAFLSKLVTIGHHDSPTLRDERFARQREIERMGAVIDDYLSVRTWGGRVYETARLRLQVALQSHGAAVPWRGWIYCYDPGRDDVIRYPHVKSTIHGLPPRPRKGA